MMSEKSVYILGVIVLFVGTGLFAWFYGSAGGGRSTVAELQGRDQVEVVLTNDGFIPRQLRISPGTRVVFSTTRDAPFWPASNLHPQHSIYPAFDPREPLRPDEKWEFVFDEKGTWGFHDHIRSYFTGIVYVEE